MKLPRTFNNNFDQRIIELRSNGTYVLFKREHVMAAYIWLQELMIQTLKNCINVEEIRTQVDYIFMRKDKTRIIGYARLKEIVQIENDSDMGQFLDYVIHLGILYRRDSNIQLSSREYCVPLLLERATRTN